MSMTELMGRREGCLEFGDVERFGEVCEESSFLTSFLCCLLVSATRVISVENSMAYYIRVSCECDNARLTCQWTGHDPLQGSIAVHHRHLNVHEYEIEMCLFGHFEPFQAVRCRWDILVAEHFEDSTTDKNVGGIVIYQQDVEWCRLIVS